ncbi:MAG TPA: DUF1801 domain-containing protein, partial [Chitinophagaceae bacterium]
MNSKVDAFLERSVQWKKEFEKLRKIVLSCGLDEDLKWGQPSYSFEGRNVVLIHGFKEYCALLFFKGALLSDPGGILIRQTENVQSARQVRFTSLSAITKLEKAMRAYIYEAIEVERAGLKVRLKKSEEYKIPDEFQQRLSKNARLKKAFGELTPGRQRAYLLHFAAAKQVATREAR